MKLIIQIPCYNEALNDLPKHIDGIDKIEYLISMMEVKTTPLK